jgi:hypothetical protein
MFGLVRTSAVCSFIRPYSSRVAGVTASRDAGHRYVTAHGTSIRERKLLIWPAAAGPDWLEVHHMCETCGSTHHVELDGEICVHFPGLENLQTPPIFVFPKLAVCLNCGNAKLKIPETELRLIRTASERSGSNGATGQFPQGEVYTR